MPAVAPAAYRNGTLFRGSFLGAGVGRGCDNSVRFVDLLFALVAASLR